MGLGDLSGPSNGAFSQEEINLGFFLNLVLFLHTGSGD